MHTAEKVTRAALEGVKENSAAPHLYTVPSCATAITIMIEIVIIYMIMFMIKIIMTAIGIYGNWDESRGDNYDDRYDSIHGDQDDVDDDGKSDEEDHGNDSIMMMMKTMRSRRDCTAMAIATTIIKRRKLRRR